MPNDITIGWDGTFRGRQIEIGVYVYTIEIEKVDGVIENMQGEILLVK